MPVGHQCPRCCRPRPCGRGRRCAAPALRNPRVAHVSRHIASPRRRAPARRFPRPPAHSRPTPPPYAFARPHQRNGATDARRWPVTNATLFFSMKDPCHSRGNAEQVLAAHFCFGRSAAFANPRDSYGYRCGLRLCIPSQIRCAPLRDAIQRCPKRLQTRCHRSLFILARAMRQRLDLCHARAWKLGGGTGPWVGYHQGLPVLRRMFARCRTA